ncbi:MAG: hypothetical protein OEQ53_09990 [Saprospiraceae bacterium]|nr:hypothetical protein [Saprospiraceae bacterium]
MLGRVKKWLGIEGVKVEVIIPEQVEHNSGVVQGILRFASMNPQTVSSVNLKMIETYKRGRRKSKLTDEYLLAERDLHVMIEVPQNEFVELDFELPFEMVKSKMDQLQEKNFILGGLVSAAKMLKGVTSQYRIEAVADVVGTALNPFDQKTFTFK